jgi:hypothetical protein
MTQMTCIMIATQLITKCDNVVLHSAQDGQT